MGLARRLMTARCFIISHDETSSHNGDPTGGWIALASAMIEQGSQPRTPKHETTGVAGRRGERSCVATVCPTRLRRITCRPPRAEARAHHGPGRRLRYPPPDRIGDGAFDVAHQLHRLPPAGPAGRDARLRCSPPPDCPETGRYICLVKATGFNVPACRTDCRRK